VPHWGRGEGWCGPPQDDANENKPATSEMTKRASGEGSLAKKKNVRGGTLGQPDRTVKWKRKNRNPNYLWERKAGGKMCGRERKDVSLRFAEWCNRGKDVEKRVEKLILVVIQRKKGGREMRGQLSRQKVQLNCTEVYEGQKTSRRLFWPEE